MTGEKRSNNAPLVISVIALCVAVATGGAYAAGKIGSKDIKPNAVKSKQIAKHAVHTKHIKPNAVKSKQVANGSLMAGDFGPGQLPQGPKGPAGPPGPVGAAVQPSPVDPATMPTLPNLGSFDFTMSKPGRALIQLSILDAAFACSAGGGCSMTCGIVLDGTPVPGSGVTNYAAASQSRQVEAHVSALVGPLASGPHTVKFSAYLGGSFSSGSFGVTGSPYSQFSVIALGNTGSVVAPAVRQTRKPPRPVTFGPHAAAG